MSFSDLEYAGELKRSRRERFLAEMDHIVPWSGLLKLIARLTLVASPIL